MVYSCECVWKWKYRDVLIMNNLRETKTLRTQINYRIIVIILIKIIQITLNWSSDT